MKNILTIALLILLSSCNKTIETKPVEFEIVDTVSEKMRLAIERNEKVKEKIVKKVITVQVLTKENKTLEKKVEVLKIQNDTLTNTLKKVRDSIVKSKTKVAKKQGFFGKLIGKKPDSIEVVKVDTIKK
jgi:hypothetical protein